MLFINLYYPFITYDGGKSNEQRAKANEQQTKSNEQQSASQKFSLVDEMCCWNDFFSICLIDQSKIVFQQSWIVAWSEVLIYRIPVLLSCILLVRSVVICGMGRGNIKIPDN